MAPVAMYLFRYPQRILISPGSLTHLGRICRPLSLAARQLSSTEGGLHLRTLTTLTDLSSDQSNTVVLVLPIEVLRAMGQPGVALPLPVQVPAPAPAAPEA